MAYSKNVFLPGEVRAYAGTTAPSGWFLCDGSAKSTADYPALFEVIGYTYGGSGASFNIPDLRGRAIAGKDNMGGTSANRITSVGSGIVGTNLGASGGLEAVTLTTNQSGQKAGSFTSGGQSATHYHGIPDAYYNDGDSSGSGYADISQFPQHTPVNTTANIGDHIHTTNISGSSAAASHSSTQPTIILNYLIKF